VLLYISLSNVLIVKRYTLKLEFQNVVIIENSVEICDFMLTEKS
jgi:hypothetical protein